MRRVAAVLAVALWAGASVASAQVDQARERLRHADFHGALEALDAAEAGPRLTRADLVVIFELRALVHSALGDTGGVTAALRALASIDPGHRFGREVPPDVVERFGHLAGQLGGPLALEVDRRPTEGGTSLHPRVLRDPTGLVRQVAVHARVDGGPWRSGGEEGVAVSAAPGQRVEWYAVATGPGSAVLAERGSARAPLAFSAGGDLLGGPGHGAGDGEGSGPWLWIGVGAGVLAVAAVVGVVLLTSSSGEPSTVVSGPTGWP